MYQALEELSAQSIFMAGLLAAGPDFLLIHLLAIISFAVVLWSTIRRRNLPHDLIAVAPLLIAGMAVQRSLLLGYYAFAAQDYHILSTVFDTSRSLLMTCVVCATLGLAATRIFAEKAERRHLVSAMTLIAVVAAYLFMFRAELLFPPQRDEFDRYLPFIGRLARASDRYPSHLSAPEQIQAIILQDLAVERNGGYYGQKEAMPLFVSTASIEEQKGEDPSKGVLDYVRFAFPTIQPVSAAELPVLGERSHAIDRATGKHGIILWVARVAISDEEELKVEAGYFINGTAAEHFEYRFKRLGDRWILAARKKVRIS